MIKLETKTYGKTDALKFLPSDLIPNFPSFTGRVNRTPEVIRSMANSLLALGQENDFSFRRGFKGEAVPITGFTRILAADLINRECLKGYRINPQGTKVEVQYGPENPFVLRGTLKALNEVDALFHTFAENTDRTELNDADIALFISAVSSSTTLTDAEIAERLGKPASYISTHRRVLLLPTNSQAALASGEISFDAAVNVLANVEPNAQAAVIAKGKEIVMAQSAARAATKQAEATAAGKKVPTKKAPKADAPVTVPAATLAEAARQLGVETAKPMARSFAEVFTMLRKQIETMPESPLKVLYFTMIDYKAGTANDDEFLAAQDAVVAAMVASTV